MKRTLLILTSIFCLVVSQQSVVFAQGVATDSAEADETTQELKKRIEKIVEEKREQVKGVIEELTSKKRGFIGEVGRISEEAITVKSITGTSIVPIDESITLLKDNEPIELANIEVSNWAIVMGEQEDESITPEYILIAEDTLRPNPQYVQLGTIVEVARDAITFLPRNSEDAVELTIENTTEFTDINKNEISTADVQVDYTALVTGYNLEEGIELKTLQLLTTVEADEE